MFSLLEPVPQQVKNFLDFCRQKKKAMDTNTLDLSDCKWIFPGTLLPLGVFLKENEQVKFLPPEDHNVANYISMMINGCNPNENSSCSYLPLIELPKNEKDAVKVIEKLYKLHNDGKEYGGEQAFKYLISEITDNIYQHSKFDKAFVTAQRYQKHKFAEICFYDNGITINGSFSKNGLDFTEDYEAIIKAINGLSTKSQERGRGLGSNLKIFTQGLKGEILIVSGGGAIYASEGKQKAYKILDPYVLQGTMVSVKIPFPAPTVDIYEYL